MAEHQTSVSQSRVPRDELLDHEFDGIQEYDNPCPSWWSWLFFLTAIFAPVYYFYFHIGKAGITIEADHQNAVNENLKLRFAEIGELKADESTLVAYMQEANWLKVGESVYQQRCKSCHGEGGAGLVGPNLTDDYYKNVQQLTDVAKVVADGAANGSMPGWGTRLHPNEVVLVSAYVASLRGQNLTGPRGNEGKEIPAWPSTAAPASDAPPGTDDETTSPPADTEPTKPA
jgi:cytochrome c oxidase cbb3-type subunit 3